jgi:hypothetical protein
MSGVEANKATSYFTAFIASAHRLSKSRITLSHINIFPGLDPLLKHTQRLRKLWQRPGMQHVKRQLIGTRKQSGE